MKTFPNNIHIALYPRYVQLVSQGHVRWIEREKAFGLLDFAVGRKKKTRFPEEVEAALKDLEQPTDRLNVADMVAARLDAIKQANLRYAHRRTGQLDASWLALAEDLFANRSIMFLPRSAWPTLPISITHRAQLFLSFLPPSSARVYLEDDIDALSLLMAQKADNFVWEPERLRRAWLTTQVTNLYLGDTLRFCKTPLECQYCDLAVVHAGGAKHTRDALERALAVTKPDGRVALCMRHPFDQWFRSACPDLAPTEYVYVRDMDHRVLASGHVIDGGGDIYVLPCDQARRLFEYLAKKQHELQHPYLSMDFFGLNTGKVAQNPLGCVADGLARRSMAQEGMRSIHQENGRAALCWYDEAGFGLSAELWKEPQHLAVTLMPYDPKTEYALVNTVYETLAGPNTRMRPVLTAHTLQGNVHVSNA